MLRYGDETDAMGVSSVSIDREMFMQCMMLNYDACNPKRVNRLFTCFDLERQDRMDFRTFLSTMRTLRRASESPAEKILAYFDFYDFLGEECLSHDDTLSLFQLLVSEPYSYW